MTVVVVGAATALVPVVMALCGIDLVTSRNLVPALVPALLGAAAGVASSRVGRAVGVALCVVSLVVVASVAVDPRYRRPDWRGAAGAIGPAHGPRALVGPPEFANTGPLRIYFGSGEWRPDGVVTVEDVTVVAFTSVGRNGTGVPRPPAGDPAPPPPGFRLTHHRRARAFTTARSDDRRPTPVPVSHLRRLVFRPDAGVVVLQRPG